MTDRMYRVDIGKEKEKLQKKLAEKGPESLTSAEMEVLHSNRQHRRKKGFLRQNGKKHRA